MNASLSQSVRSDCRKSYTTHSPRKLALVGELRNVIDRDGLELHYQPKMEITTGRVIGAVIVLRDVTRPVG